MAKWTHKGVEIMLDGLTGWFEADVRGTPIRADSLSGAKGKVERALEKAIQRSRKVNICGAILFTYEEDLAVVRHVTFRGIHRRGGDLLLTWEGNSLRLSDSYERKIFRAEAGLFDKLKAVADGLNRATRARKEAEAALGVLAARSSPAKREPWPREEPEDKSDRYFAFLSPPADSDEEGTS